MGSYIPTSTYGEITKGWTRLALAIVCFIFAILIASRKGRAKGDMLVIAVLIVLLPVLFTPFSILPVPVYGILATFLIFALLISTRFDNLQSSKLVDRTFLFLNWANIFLSVGILFHLVIVQAIFTSMYSSAFPELVPMMMEMGKPVLTYSTHSLAAFVHYLFFWVNFCTYRVTGKPINLFFALMYTVFLFSLLSVSGVFFFCAACAQLAWMFLRGNLFKAVLCCTLIVLVFSGLVGFLASQGYFSAGVTSEFQGIISAQGNGFLGRYSYAGSLLPVLSYLEEHPFRPTGLMSDEDMLLVDSGPLGYYVRGSILLVVLMYSGYFLFLKRNLRDQKQAYFLFAVTICFEVGFSALTSFRAICLFPLIVVYLNGLRLEVPQIGCSNATLSPATSSSS